MTCITFQSIVYKYGGSNKNINIFHIKHIAKSKGTNTYTYHTYEEMWCKVKNINVDDKVCRFVTLTNVITTR